jgi:hypothetical protein
VPQSVFDAIKMGMWDYEPTHSSYSEALATHAMPGSLEKLDVLAERLRLGLPLWHPEDKIHYEDAE